MNKNIAVLVSVVMVVALARRTPMRIHSIKGRST